VLVLTTGFPTSRIEMEAVASIFDPNNEGVVDYKAFLASLKPDRDHTPAAERPADVEIIQDELTRQAAKCTCCKQYNILRVGEGKYRVGIYTYRLRYGYVTANVKAFKWKVCIARCNYVVLCRSLASRRSYALSEYYEALLWFVLVADGCHLESS
jgi:hypothetical protein